LGPKETTSRTRKLAVLRIKLLSGNRRERVPEGRDLTADGVNDEKITGRKFFTVRERVDRPYLYRRPGADFFDGDSGGKGGRKLSFVK